MIRLLLLLGFILGWSGFAMAQSSPHRALDNYAVTSSGVAVSAFTGFANGCNISSSSFNLIIDATGATAGTSPSATGQLQPAGAAPYQCGPVPSSRSISVNCAGGGTCTWTGDRW